MINREGFLKNVEEKDVELLKNNPQEFWNGVIWIGELAFRDLENLTSITIPDGIKTIGDFAFLGCENLTSITIPESVTNIGSGAFTYCSNLKSITIPNGAINVGDGLFEGCEKLKKVVFQNIGKLKEELMKILEGFNFDSFEGNGDEVTFVRNVEKQEENE